MFAEAVFRSMGRDHRSQKEKANIGWNHVWMEETDLQGCKLGDWAERVDASTYRCKLCNKVGVVQWNEKWGRLQISQRASPERAQFG